MLAGSPERSQKVRQAVPGLEPHCSATCLSERLDDEGYAPRRFIPIHNRQRDALTPFGGPDDDELTRLPMFCNFRGFHLQPGNLRA